MHALRIAALLLLTLTVAGCSTKAWFKLPEDSTLVISDRPAHNNQGLVSSRPFSWGLTGGIPYRIEDSQANTIRSGKLKSRFRVASIFWPPVGIAYWPMGFGQRCFDLTGEAPQTCTYQDLVELRQAHRLRR